MPTYEFVRRLEPIMLWGGNWDDIFSYAGGGVAEIGSQWSVVFFDSFVGTIVFKNNRAKQNFELSCRSSPIGSSVF